MGEWKAMSGEFADLMLGYYGATLGSKDEKVQQIAAEKVKKPVITCRPADLIPNEFDKLRAEALALEGDNGSDEDVLTYAMFPQVAPKFFKSRHEGPKNPSKEAPTPAPQAAATAERPAPAHPGQLSGPITYAVTFNGHAHKVTVAPGE
jgi:methylmalonyl-CoA carboxyltransferase 5S subunit